MDDSIWPLPPIGAELKTDATNGGNGKTETLHLYYGKHGVEEIRLDVKMCVDSTMNHEVSSSSIDLFYYARGFPITSDVAARTEDETAAGWKPLIRGIPGDAAEWIVTADVIDRVRQRDDIRDKISQMLDAVRKTFVADDVVTCARDDEAAFRACMDAFSVIFEVSFEVHCGVRKQQPLLPKVRLNDFSGDVVKNLISGAVDYYAPQASIPYINREIETYPRYDQRPKIITFLSSMERHSSHQIVRATKTLLNFYRHYFMTLSAGAREDICARIRNSSRKSFSSDPLFQKPQNS